MTWFALWRWLLSQECNSDSVLGGTPEVSCALNDLNPALFSTAPTLPLGSGCADTVKMTMQKIPQRAEIYLAGNLLSSRLQVSWVTQGARKCSRLDVQCTHCACAGLTKWQDIQLETNDAAWWWRSDDMWESGGIIQQTYWLKVIYEGQLNSKKWILNMLPRNQILTKNYHAKENTFSTKIFKI